MPGRPRPQGILPFQVEVSDKFGSTTARAGLPLVIETMHALGLPEAIKKHINVGQRSTGFGDVEKIEALVLLQAAGGSCFDDIRVLQTDEGLCRLLGRKLPSSDVLRNFLYAFHDDALMEAGKAGRRKGTVAFIPKENAPLSGLARVNQALVHAVAAQGRGIRATLDHDATIQESHKREALAHYKGGRGYQPVCIYWAEQDLVVGDEYRDGNVPAGMRNLPLISQAFRSLPPTVTELFFRADSACYHSAVIKWLANAERANGPQGPIGFTISADMTTELRALALGVPEAEWAFMEERSDAVISAAEVEFAPGNWPKTAEPMRYVLVRIKKRQGEFFLTGSDTRFLAVVSNRRDLGGTELLRWHWQKAGTIEHIHDITKNELGAGTPPSGRFGTNAAWYRLCLLTYNVLSALRSLALPSQFNSARPKKLRFALFNLAGSLSEHAGKLVLRIARAAERLIDFVASRRRLAALVISTV